MVYRLSGSGVPILPEYTRVVDHPRAGVHYPRSVGELQAWFRVDADCLDYLEWLRWPAGFVCPDCGHPGGWRLGDGRFECAGCGHRTSVTAGTIFGATGLAAGFTAVLAAMKIGFIVVPDA